MSLLSFLIACVIMFVMDVFVFSRALFHSVVIPDKSWHCSNSLSTE